MTTQLEKLAALPPRTKSGKIRAYMPEIERRIADGVALKAIIEWLAEGGINVTLPTFKSYLYRYRQETKGQTPPAQTMPQPQPAQPITDRNTGTDPEPIEDGNPDSETPSPEPDPEPAIPTKLADILDAKKGDALTDQYMTRRKPLIGRKRSEGQ